MKTPRYFLLLCGLFLAGCGQKTDPSTTAVNTTNAPGSNPLNAPSDYLGAIVDAKQRAVKTIDTVSLDQAVQTFSVEHGRYPKDLDELVQTKVIPKIPDPPRGMKLVYDANTGTVKVEKQ
jgi:putative lipoprotein